MLPSSVVTVIVAVPALTAVTFPLSTVATALSLEDHVTFLLVALDGLTVAVRVVCSPSVNSVLVTLRETLSTLIVSGRGFSHDASSKIIMLSASERYVLKLSMAISTFVYIVKVFTRGFNDTRYIYLEFSVQLRIIPNIYTFALLLQNDTS